MEFTHYGNSGDVIYSLYCIKGLGGGTLYLTDKRMTRYYYSILAPLILQQPYILDLIYTNDIPSSCIDLNCWRTIDPKIRANQHIIQSHIDGLKQHYNLHLEWTGTPWLTNIPKVIKPSSYILIQRTPRYQNSSFDYTKWIEPTSDLYFCGLQEEYIRFIAQYHMLTVQYKTTIDFYDFAVLIRNSKYFLGNQSTGSAICQGLGHPQIQEQSPKEPNCIPKYRYVTGFNYGHINN